MALAGQGLAGRDAAMPSHSPLPVPGGPRAGCGTGVAGRLQFGVTQSCPRPMCRCSCPCPLTLELRSRVCALLAASPPHSSPKREPAGSSEGGPQPTASAMHHPPGAAGHLARLLLPDPPHSPREERSRFVSTGQMCQYKAATSRPAPPGGASPSRCLMSICFLSGSDSSSGSFRWGLGTL